MSALSWPGPPRSTSGSRSGWRRSVWSKRELLPKRRHRKKRKLGLSSKELLPKKLGLQKSSNWNKRELQRKRRPLPKLKKLALLRNVLSKR